MTTASKENKLTYTGQNLHKLDQNKIYKTGQKNRHEKSTRCTWEPGIVCPQ